MSTRLFVSGAEGRRPRAFPASVPMQPAPGVLRLKLGDATVTALLDRSIDLPLALFPRTDEAEAVW